MGERLTKFTGPLQTLVYSVRNLLTTKSRGMGLRRREKERVTVCKSHTHTYESIYVYKRERERERKKTTFQTQRYENDRMR